MAGRARRVRLWLLLALWLSLQPPTPAIAGTPPWPVAAGEPLAPPPAVLHPAPGPDDPLYPELADQAPALSARAAVLLDARTGAILYAHNATMPREPASTTKVMTALLALEFGNLDDVVVVSRRAAATPGSRAHIAAGQRFRLRDLLYGLLLPSGNDAAIAIAEHISGSVPRFVALMNEQAQRLGMTGTRFRNPHGLPAPGHVSTALDLARLTLRASHEPEFLRISCTRWQEVCELGSGQRLRWSNTNELLWSFPFIEGGKTGTTRAAGRCLVAVARRGSQRLIAVVLNAPDRWGDVRRLFEWGFDRFALQQAARIGDRLGEVPVRGGTIAQVPVIVDADLVAAVPAERAADVRLRLDLPAAVDAPILAQQRLGQAQLVLDGRVLAVADVRAAREVGRLTPLRRLTLWMFALQRWLAPQR